MNVKPKKHPCIFEMKKDGKVYRYIVRASINKVKTYVGCYETLEQAKEAYEKFKKRTGHVVHGV